MRTIADLVLVAAGKSSRFNRGENKTLVSLQETPVFWYSLKKMLHAGWFNNLVLVVPAKDKTLFNNELARLAGQNNKITVLTGGQMRHHSVQIALKFLASLSEASEYIFIHDAARPLFSLKLLNQLWQVCQKGKASAPVVKINDLIRLRQAEHYTALEAAEYYSTQTPQVILRPWLKDYFLDDNYLKLKPRDELSIVMANNLPYELITGEVTNLKITYFQDILAAQDILALNAKKNFCCGYQQTKK